MEYLVDAVGPVEIAAGIVRPHRGFPVQPLNLILRRLQFRGQVCYLVSLALRHNIQNIPVVVVVGGHGLVSLCFCSHSMRIETIWAFRERRLFAATLSIAAFIYLGTRRLI